ncbi:hypothetical protein DAEQUDRAFT_427394 [Daedalea quercina L-15889]|uniref:Uncharacterized protein n=1 Tax=Daedalea quercina L-15889 TaxID=1314783 RepID=A0A165NIU2_9APHY|nr:hypothetical protein DAEQUDRAFT_427394 [Daedalea quercina L-15889]
MNSQHIDLTGTHHDIRTKVIGEFAVHLHTDGRRRPRLTSPARPEPANHTVPGPCTQHGIRPDRRQSADDLHPPPLPVSPPTAQQKYQPSHPFGTLLNGLITYGDPRTHLEDALKRSVTVVFWYKLDSPPIRLHGEVTTFPLFQLSQFAHLAADLGLAPAAYVDAYSPHAPADNLRDTCAGE